MSPWADGGRRGTGLAVDPVWNHCQFWYFAWNISGCVPLVVAASGMSLT